MVLISRDVIWLNKVYGDYKGTRGEVKWERIGVIPKAFKFGPEPQQDAVPNAQQQEGQQQDLGVPEQDENVRRNNDQRTGVHTRRSVPQSTYRPVFREEFG